MRSDTLRNLKVVGVEDGGFSRNIAQRREALLVAVNMLECVWICGVKVELVKVDGLDATEKLISALRSWEFDVVMLAGVSFAGFNLIDPTIVYEKYGKPVIIVVRKKPNNVAVKKALKEHFEDWRVRWAIFEGLGPVYAVSSFSNESPIYFEVVGTEPKWACKLIQASAVLCRIPEPLRVARLIARGLTINL